MDGHDRVGVEHLTAALALWDYAEKSTVAIFGEMSGDPTADRILVALNEHQDMTETEIRDLFGRHKSSNEIDRALNTLKASGKLKDEIVTTGGRPKTIWRRCAKSD
jgi:predicted HTH transcriptional regulator